MPAHGIDEQANPIRYLRTCNSLVSCHTIVFEHGYPNMHSNRAGGAPMHWFSALDRQPTSSSCRRPTSSPYIYMWDYACASTEARTRLVHCEVINPSFTTSINGPFKRLSHDHDLQSRETIARYAPLKIRDLPESSTCAVQICMVLITELWKS